MKGVLLPLLPFIDGNFSDLESTRCDTINTKCAQYSFISCGRIKCWYSWTELNPWLLSEPLHSLSKVGFICWELSDWHHYKEILVELSDIYSHKIMILCWPVFLIISASLCLGRKLEECLLWDNVLRHPACVSVVEVYPYWVLDIM